MCTLKLLMLCIEIVQQYKKIVQAVFKSGNSFHDTCSSLRNKMIVKGLHTLLAPSPQK